MSNRIVQNMSSLFILQGANYILPLITLPYLLRVLGPENFGVVAFAQAFVQYFVILTDYGFNLSATRQVSLKRGDISELSRLFCAVMSIKAVLAIVSLGLMTVIVLTFPLFHGHYQVYYAAFLAVIGNAMFPVWFFQGMERMKYITVLNIIAKVLAAAAIFLLVQSKDDFLLAAGIQASGMVIAGILSLIVVRRVAPIHLAFPGMRELWGSLEDGWHVFLSSAAVSLYTSTNIVVLGLVTNNAIVGYFSAADKLVKAAQSLLTPISQAIFPHINTLVSKSKADALTFLNKSLKLFASVGLFLSLGIFVFAPQLVAILLGDRYLPVVDIIRWLAFLPFIVGLSNVLGVQTMLPFGLKRQFSVTLVVAGLINTALIIPLAYQMGASGAAISVFLTEVFVTVSMSLSLRRNGINVFTVKERTV